MLHMISYDFGNEDFSLSAMSRFEPAALAASAGRQRQVKPLPQVQGAESSGPWRRKKSWDVSRMSQAFSRQGEMMYDDVCWCNASRGAKSHWRRCDIPLQQRFVQSVDDATESFEGTPHELRFPDRRETLYRSLQALATLAIRFQSGPGLTASIELGRMVCPHVRFQFALKQGTKECINMCARNCKWHLCNYTVRVYIYI